MPRSKLQPNEPDLGPPPPQPDQDIRPPERIPQDEDRQKVVTSEQEEIAAEGEEVTELSDEERQWFNTLMTVGRRSKTINVMGHSVVIQNLCTDDDLRIGLFCKEFQGAAPADQRAYQLATCACGIRAIDNQPIHQPLGEISDDEIFDVKITKLRKYYPVVITQIYREILSLDGEFIELAQKLGKLEG